MESFKTVKQRCHKKLRELLDALTKEGENYGISRDIDMSKIFESCTVRVMQLYERLRTRSRQ